MSRTIKVKDIRFTLNGKNEKDALIIDFLDRQYSTNDYIKQVLYRLASDNLKAAYVRNNGESLFNGDNKENDNEMEISSLKNDSAESVDENSRSAVNLAEFM